MFKKKKFDPNDPKECVKYMVHELGDKFNELSCEMGAALKKNGYKQHDYYHVVMNALSNFAAIAAMGPIMNYPDVKIAAQEYCLAIGKILKKNIEENTNDEQCAKTPF